MTMSAPTTETTPMPPANFAAALEKELASARRQAEWATDLTGTMAALDRYADIVITADNARLIAGAEAKRLIAEALRAGADPRDLYGRPFSSTVVRQIAAAIGLRFPHRGRRPRRTERSS